MRRNPWSRGGWTSESPPRGRRPAGQRRKGLGIKQGTPPLPAHALAAQLRPHRLAEGAPPLRGLVRQDRQQHAHGTHPREMLRAMAVVVLKVRALLCQGVAGLGVARPPRAATPQALPDVARGHAAVWHPTAMRPRVMASLPVREAVNPHGRVGRMAGDIMATAQALDALRRTVMPCILGDRPSLVRCLPVLAQRGLIAFLATQEGAQSMRVAGLDRGALARRRSAVTLHCRGG
jgi:hypothetical protein